VRDRQGYYFSKPVDAEKAHWLIRDKDILKHGFLLKPVSRIEEFKPLGPKGPELDPTELPTPEAA